MIDFFSSAVGTPLTFLFPGASPAPLSLSSHWSSQFFTEFRGMGWIVACFACRVRFRHFFLVCFPRLLFGKGSRRRFPIELRELIAARLSLSLSLSLNVCWCEIHFGHPIVFWSPIHLYVCTYYVCWSEKEGNISNLWVWILNSIRAFGVERKLKQVERSMKQAAQTE